MASLLPAVFGQPGAGERMPMKVSAMTMPRRAIMITEPIEGIAQAAIAHFGTAAGLCP